MTRSWKAFWGASAAAGATSLVLGIIQSFNERDFCAAGSHYEYFWLTLAGVLLAAPIGAWAVARTETPATEGTNRQIVYLGGVLLVIALAIVVWQVTAVDVPWFRDRDFPFGDGVACGL